MQKQIYEYNIKFLNMSTIKNIIILSPCTKIEPKRELVKSCKLAYLLTQIYSLISISCRNNSICKLEGEFKEKVSFVGTAKDRCGLIDILCVKTDTAFQEFVFTGSSNSWGELSQTTVS